jgi:hypothetical protein
MYPKTLQSITGTESPGSSGVTGVFTPVYTPYFFQNSQSYLAAEFEWAP